MSMTTIAAAALPHMPQVGPDFRPVLDDMGRLVPLFSLDEVREMTAAQFVSLFDMDRDVYATWDGPNIRWNYTPRLIQAHRQKTRRDRRNIALPGQERNDMARVIVSVDVVRRMASEAAEMLEAASRPSTSTTCVLAFAGW